MVSMRGIPTVVFLFFYRRLYLYPLFMLKKKEGLEEFVHVENDVVDVPCVIEGDHSNRMFMSDQ